MKFFKHYFFLIFTVVLLFSCSSKNKFAKSPDILTPIAELVPGEDERSLLWEISGNKLKKKSYLFGTIHMISEEDYFMPQEVTDALGKCDLLTLEIDMDDPMIMLKSMKGVMMKGGVTMKDLLTKEEYTLLSDYFKEKLGIGLGMFKSMKPMLLSAMVSEQMNMGKVVSYEEKLMGMAKSNKLSIEGLETIEYQMSIFDSIPYQLQADMLMESLVAENADPQADFEKMIEVYKSQDLQALYGSIKADSEGIESFEELLLVNRNTNWIPVIEQMAYEQPTFFAVGAGHLGGEIGVIALLRKRGYTLTPLLNRNN